MKIQVLVVAPHPDDETLGCGGALLRHVHDGCDIHWLIVTAMSKECGFSSEQIAQREREVDCVAARYQFTSVTSLQLPTTSLDSLPMGDIVAALNNCIKQINPGIVYIPYPGDVHTDHRIVFDAVASCTKWFRQPSVKRLLAYETLSETGFGIDPTDRGFQPNVFINISEFLDEKLDILEVYNSEMGVFPFPRSLEAVRSLATLRGSTAGCNAAEAFMLLKEIM